MAWWGDVGSLEVERACCFCDFEKFELFESFESFGSFEGRFMD